jgi:hypothetical protein
MAATLHESPGDDVALSTGRRAMRAATLHDIKKMPLLLRLFSLVSK